MNRVKVFREAVKVVSVVTTTNELKTNTDRLALVLGARLDLHINDHMGASRRDN